MSVIAESFAAPPFPWGTALSTLRATARTSHGPASHTLGEPARESLRACYVIGGVTDFLNAFLEV
jgi:hypothetical protein